MRAFTRLAIVCIVAAIAAPASADDPKPPKEKRVCRAVPGTSSIVPTTVCHTASQWEQLSQARKERLSQSKDGARPEATKKGD